ncbi:MAG: TAXI family TRAP transporter solute-binding subunit [Clostridia bacterium]|nr:TAXI family TRAP transporter solute-binding subunit [Clostridia bacterium]
MKKLISLFLCALLCLSMLAACGGNEEKGSEKTVINFPTASASGALYAVGAAITNLWDTEIENVSAASQASTGGIENLNLVSEGEAQVSIAISSNCYECLNGEGSFDGYAYDDLKVIAGLYLNPNQMVVTEGSGIESLVDVKGKHFAVASAGSSVYGECYNHFTAAGLTFPDDINCEYITFADAADMLQNGTIDGAWIMSGAPASAVTQACTSGCRLVGVDEQTISDLQAQYPWYVPYTIPAGTYPGQDEDVNTSAIKMVMFCRGDLSEDVVYELTKVFWENIDSLGESQAVLKGLTPEEAVRDIAELPLHPGAEKYYKEIGVID